LGYNYQGDEQNNKWDKEEIAVTKVIKNIIDQYRKNKIYENFQFIFILKWYIMYTQNKKGRRNNR